MPTRRLSVITYSFILFVLVSGCKSIQENKMYTAEYSTERIKKMVS